MSCNCTSQDDFSASNISENGCPFQIPGTCSFYSGLAIPSLGINPGDTLDSVVRKIAIYIGAINGSINTLREDVDVLSGDTTSSTTTTTTTPAPTTSTTTTTTTTPAVTTSTTTTSTTTSGVTTSTTSTTTTSTTTAPTTSTTTTSTTTAAGVTSTVYIGSNDTGTAPDASAILAGLTSTQNETLDVTANWTSFNAAPHFLWFAIKQNGVNSNKNQWFESVSNFGAIGTVDDLFGALTTVTVSGTAYYVGITNYATQFTSSVLLKHI